MPPNLYKRCTCPREARSSCPHEWHYRFEHQGNKYRGTTGARDRRRAERIARGKRAEIEADPPRPAKGKGGLTLVDGAALDILEHEQRGVSAIHLRRLRDRWRKVLSVAGDGAVVRLIDYDWLRSYEGRRRNAGIRGQTIVREVQAIRRVLAIAERRGLIERVPKIPEIRRDPPDPKRSGKYRAPELVRAFLGMLHDDARDEVAFVALTGIRWGELKRLRYDWFEPAPASFGVPALLRLPGGATKTGEPREVGVPALALAIVERRQKTATSPLVFGPEDYKKHRQRVSKKLGLEHTMTLRDLRHTFASIAMQRSGDPTAVLRALGHKDLKMTERYLTAPLERVAQLGAAAEAALGADPDTTPDTGDDELVTH